MGQLEAINYWLALGTFLMQAGAAGLCAAYFLRSRFSFFARVSELAGTWGLPLALVFSALGSLLTLYYSEVLGLAPCPLCWWQRAFLYPQVVLFLVALWKRDVRIADYSIALSVAGAVVALYHHMLQVLPAGVLPCPAITEGVSCAQRFVFEFGYITFPLMSFSLFAFLIAIMLFVRTTTTPVRNGAS